MTVPVLTVLGEVWVAGHPKTKGSLDFVTKTHVRESVSGSDHWRKLVAQQLRVAHGGRPPFEGRAGVRILSYLQPSRLALERGPESWILGRTSGDVDKLGRNVLDALTDSGMIKDDAQVWDLMSCKRLAMPGMLPGQKIQVWAIPEGSGW